MQIIKLNAIDSTNQYLKLLVKNSVVDTFTVVVTNHQTHGKGQMGAQWMSEQDKNLTFSVLVKDIIVDLKDVFLLNVAVSLALKNVLNQLTKSNFFIKWPNDIMSGHSKVAGILIENIIKNNHDIYSIIGIGLNVNQTVFEGLPNTTSLKNITNKSFDLEQVLNLILNELKPHLLKITHNKPKVLWNEYQQCLYRKNKPTAFEDNSGFRFMGIIKEVTKDGKLSVLLEDDSINLFDVKQIKLLI